MEIAPAPNVVASRGFTKKMWQRVLSAVRGEARTVDNTHRGFTAKTWPGGGVGLWGMGQAAWKI